MGDFAYDTSSKEGNTSWHHKKNSLPPGTLPIYWVAARIMSSNSHDPGRFELPDPADSGGSGMRM
jgi:hypothetical protein